MSKLLEVKDLCKYFKTPKGALHAVEGLSFSIDGDTTLGVVGESGCGKSTLGRVIMGLHEPTGGALFFEGQDVTHPDKVKRRELNHKIQMIFQDPASSLDPRMCVSDLIAEPMKAMKICKTKQERDNRVAELMDTVGLARRLAFSYPHELDGGRRQRIGIARALAVNPKFIVCDEPVSALDVSIQAQIINLLMDLREQKGLTYLMISHDLSMVKHVSDRIIVMYLGKIVETCPAEELYEHPTHPYTQALISAIPIADPKVERERERIILTGQVPSPSDKPKGCAFAGRCRYASERCREEEPCLREAAPGHCVACHMV